MLHIVQVVVSGSAETPQAFFDEVQAHAAYVACARKYWAASFAAFCERNNLDGDGFASAQAFVASFDLADRSRIHYWQLAPEDAEAGVDQLLPGVAALAEKREQVQRLVHEVTQASDIVRESLTELLEIVGGVTGEEASAPVMPSEPAEASGRNAPGRLAPAEPAVEEPAAEPPKPDDERFKSKEWQSYVGSIINMCGGNRSEFPLFTRHDWRQAVYSSETSMEYWDWAALQIDDHIEMAQRSGYSVVDDPDKPGHYRFRTPDGVVSDISCDAEGDAWCRAGLHLKGR